jgi:hypothetical protein
VEVLHAVFHRALVGADLVVAALHQGLAAGVHAQGDLVVLDAGLHVGGLLGFDELALEGGDLLGVEELHHVERLLRALADTAWRPPARWGTTPPSRSGRA